MQERISCYLPKRPWTIIQVTSVHQDSNEYSEIQQSSVGNFLILMFPENNSTRVPSMAALSPLLENLLCVTYHKLYQNFLAEPVMQLWWLISLLNHKICLLYLLKQCFVFMHWTFHPGDQPSSVLSLTRANIFFVFMHRTFLLAVSS